MITCIVIGAAWFALSFLVAWRVGVMLKGATTDKPPKGYTE